MSPFQAQSKTSKHKSFLQRWDYTRRSGSIWKYFGVDRAIFLTYFFRLSGNQHVQNNKCQKSQPQPSKILFVTENTVTAARWATKPLPIVFASLPLPAGELKLFKPPSYAGYGSFWMQRGNWESFFIWIHEFDKTKLHCNQMMTLRILKMINNHRNQLRINASSIFFFPRGYFSLFVNCHFSDGHSYDHRHIHQATSHSGLLFLSRVYDRSAESAFEQTV